MVTYPSLKSWESRGPGFRNCLMTGIRYVSRFTFLLQNTVSEMQVESSSTLKNE